MLVLPLGLGTKLRRWPIVTMMIGLVWLIAFFVDHSDQRIANGMVASVGRTGMRDAARRLFVEYCTSHKGKSDSCQRYAQLIWTGFPAKTQSGLLQAGAAQSKIPASKLQPLHVQASMQLGGLAGGGASAEIKRAEVLREELRDCGSSKTCFQYKEMIWTFLEGHLDRALPSVVHLPSFRQYDVAQHDYLNLLHRLCVANDCLMPGQIGLKTLMLAQIRHGGVFHLLANLFALVLFGIYVEQRGSRLVYFGALVAGGTVGMAAYTAFFGTQDTIVLGGSAMVSAAMGMFYVFFFNSKLRFLVWLPRKIYAGTRFSADMRYSFPLFFLLSDIVGGLDSGFADLATHKVAHVAHLIAFAFGMLAAYVIGRWRAVPAPLIYEAEARVVHDLTYTRNLPRLFSETTRLISWNPENIAVRELTCSAALRSSVLSRQEVPQPLRHQAHVFLVEHLATVCAVNARQGGFRFICQLLTRVPIWLPLSEYLGRLGALNILKVADFALGQAHMILAFRLYDLYLMRFPLSVNARLVEASAADAVAHLTSSKETILDVESYLRSHPQSLLAPRLAAWLTNSDRRSA